MMICTGLRKSELASITVAQVYLDEQHPCVELLAKDEKAGRGAMIPLRGDLVADLRAYVDMLRSRVGLARLPHDMRLFPMPADMIRVFDRDLAAADIAKYDERGRVVDIHALRHTFGTHLARAGVSPRVAMAAMRHSSIELTMNVYTDGPSSTSPARWRRCRHSMPLLGPRQRRQPRRPKQADGGM